MKLKKYKLANLGPNQKYLNSPHVPGGKCHINAITDEIAEKLYNHKSRYVQISSQEKESGKK